MPINVRKAVKVRKLKSDSESKLRRKKAKVSRKKNLTTERKKAVTYYKKNKKGLLARAKFRRAALKKMGK